MREMDTERGNRRRRPDHPSVRRPGSQDQAATLIRDVSERIMLGFSGRRSVLRLDFPLITYNPDHIIRIEFGAFTPEQWARALEDAKRRTIGFRTS